MIAANRPLESTYGRKDRSIKRSAYSSPKRRYIYEEPIYSKGRDYEYYDYISKTQKLSAKKALYESSTYKSPLKYSPNFE